MPVVEDLELQQDPAELDDQEPERHDRRGELAQEVAEPRLRLDRLVPAIPVLVRLGNREARSVGRVDRIVLRVAVLVYDPWPIHSSPPTYVSFFQRGTVTFNSSIAS